MADSVIVWKAAVAWSKYGPSALLRSRLACDWIKRDGAERCRRLDAMIAAIRERES